MTRSLVTRGTIRLLEAEAAGELQRAARHILTASHFLQGETGLAPLAERIAHENPEFLRREKPALYIVPPPNSEPKLY